MPTWILLHVFLDWSNAFDFIDLVRLVAAVDYNAWIQILRHLICKRNDMSQIHIPDGILPRFHLNITQWPSRDKIGQYLADNSFCIKSRLIDKLIQKGCTLKRTEMELRFGHDCGEEHVSYIADIMNAIVGRFTLQGLDMYNLKWIDMETSLPKLMWFVPISGLSLSSKLCGENEAGSANLAFILGVQAYVDNVSYESDLLHNKGVQWLDVQLPRQNSYRMVQICSSIMYSRTITEIQLNDSHDQYGTLPWSLNQLNCWKWFAMAVLSPFACNKVNQLRLYCSLDPGIIAAMKSILIAHNPMKLLLASQHSMIFHDDDDNECMNMATISGPKVINVYDLVSMKKHPLIIPMGNQLCVPCANLIYSRNADDQNLLEAIIPGFGLCLLGRQDITSIVPVTSSNKSSGGIKELVLSPRQAYGGISTILCFLNFFTTSLIVLQIDLSRIDRLHVDSSTWTAILTCFPCLRSLSLISISCENLDQLITSYDSEKRCMIRSLTLKKVAMMDPSALDRFFVALGDSNHYRIGRVLEELKLYPIAVTEDDCDVVDWKRGLKGCINNIDVTLSRNHVLQYLEFHVPVSMKELVGNTNLSKIVVGEHISIHHQLALLSISHSRALPVLMIQLILEFASNIRQRNVVFHYGERE